MKVQTKKIKTEAGIFRLFQNKLYPTATSRLEISLLPFLIILIMAHPRFSRMQKKF